MTKLRARLVLTTALALGAGSLAAAPASSQTKPGPDPRATSVSSDGTRRAAPPVAVAGLPQYEGSGRPPTAAEHNLASIGPEARTAKPRDAAGRESIIGPDERTLVTPTTNFPARAIVAIYFTVPGEGSALCSGFMINPKTVATAGHCVAPGGTGGFFDKATYAVYPGANGTTAPYGGCTVSNLYSVSGWVDSADERFDYGAINLNCSVGNTVGWLGIFYQSASPDLNGLPVSVAGYPGDKPGTQWKSMGTIRAYGPYKIYYDDDTEAGQSGSPVYRFRPTGTPYCVGYCARAIHTNGPHGATPPHSQYNHATRITISVLQNLVNWIGSP